MSDTITITGNVATAPEHKRTPSGIPVTTFRIASAQRRYDRGTGAWVDAGTNWYTVSAFRSLADHAFQSLRKGDRVLLTGRLRLRPWDTGTKKGIAIEIDAEAIGHDLLWGTTTFVKDAPATTVAQPDEWAAEATAGEWLAPGADDPQAVEGGTWVVPGADADVDADARQLEPSGAATPF